jgi:hypothetical protein
VAAVYCVPFIKRSPSILTEPVTVCPVVKVLACDNLAKAVESNPSRVSAFAAYEDETEYDAEIAFDVVPLIVAFIVPRTVKSP